MNDAILSPAILAEVVRWVPVVIVLGAILWTGRRGWWYWGPGVRAHVRSVELARDDWRAIALALLRDKGIKVDAPALDLPPELSDLDPDAGASH